MNTKRIIITILLAGLVTTAWWNQDNLITWYQDDSQMTNNTENQLPSGSPRPLTDDLYVVNGGVSVFSPPSTFSAVVLIPQADDKWGFALYVKGEKVEHEKWKVFPAGTTHYTLVHGDQTFTFGNPPEKAKLYIPLPS